MTLTQTQIANLDWLADVKKAREHCAKLGIKLDYDQEQGFWLSDGEHKRYVRYVNEIKSWANYLDKHGF